MSSVERTDDGPHPLEPETVVEYVHPDDRIGDSEGQVRRCWRDADGLQYRILDMNLENVEVSADRITAVRGHPDELDGDGGGA